jgi:hypothetical protein
MASSPASWPARRIAFWALLAALAVAWQGHAFLKDFRPPRRVVVDFFQEWASARNWLNGSPVYEPQRASALRYLGKVIERDDPYFVEINAHPPTAMLLGLPFAELSYRGAVLAWNLLSLAALAGSVWLLTRQLGLAWCRWHVLPLVALTMLCWPLRQQFQQGQLSLLLLLLLVGAWAAYRSGRERLAGVLLGIAAVLKIFPAFVFLYFLFRRRWRVVAAGAGCALVLTLMTAAVLGPQVYAAYFHEVPALAGEWRAAWNNTSLPGLWSKLFDPGIKSNAVEPLTYNPLLARWLVLLSCAMVITLLAVVVRQAQTRAECDRAFAAVVVGMLLLAPVTWEHSLLLLLLPLAVFWKCWPAASRPHRVLQVLTVVLLLSPRFYYQMFRVGGDSASGRALASTAQTVLVLSLQTYALLAVFVLIVQAARQRRPVVVKQVPAHAGAAVFAMPSGQRQRVSA